MAWLEREDVTSRSLNVLDALLSCDISTCSAKMRQMCVCLNADFLQANVESQSEFIEPFMKILHKQSKRLHAFSADAVWEKTQDWCKWQKVFESLGPAQHSRDFKDISSDLQQQLEPLPTDSATLALKLQNFTGALAIPFFVLVKGTIKLADFWCSSHKTDTNRIAKKIQERGLSIKDMNRASFYYSSLDVLGQSCRDFIQGGTPYKDLVAATAETKSVIDGPVGYTILELKVKLTESPVKAATKLMKSFQEHDMKGDKQVEVVTHIRPVASSEEETRPSLRNVTIVIGSVDCRGCPIIGEVQMTACHSPSKPHHAFMHHILYEFERLVGYPPADFRAELCNIITKIFVRTVEVERLSAWPSIAPLSLKPTEISEADLRLTEDFPGRGTFKIARKAFYQSVPRIYAFFVGPHDETQTQMFTNEVLLMSSVRHPNLVQFIACCPEKRGILMEFFPHTLLDVLKKPRQWTIRKGLRLMTGVALALIELHRRNIMHRDIKPGNIFLTVDGNKLKLGDLGNAKELFSETQNTPGVGTPMYRAPEVEKGDYGFAADVFSLACVVYQVIQGRSDFQLPSRGEIPRDFEPILLWPFLLRCWDSNPRARPSAFEFTSVLQKISGIGRQPGECDTINSGLDISQLVNTIEQRHDRNKELVGKDLVILLGESGAGKSATGQFLSGNQMKVEVAKFCEEGVEQEKTFITCDEPCHEFEIGHDAHSKTKFISMRIINGLHLCDAPGFFDTSGVRADIENSIAVSNVMKRAHSVVILLCLKWSSLESQRSRGIKILLAKMLNFIPSLCDHLTAVVPAFTHVPIDKSVQAVNAFLMDLRRDLAENDAKEEKIRQFLYFLARQEKDPILRPITASNLDWIERLQCARPILGADYLLPLSQPSLIALRDYCTQTLDSTNQLLENYDIAPVGVCFYNLQTVASEVSLLEPELFKMHMLITKFLEKCVFFGCKSLELNDISELSKFISVCQEVETVFWDQCALRSFKSTLLTYVVDNCKSTLDEIDLLFDFHSLRPLLHKCLDVQTLLGSLLPPDWAEVFLLACKKVEDKEKLEFKSLTDALTQKDFQTLSRLNFLRDSREFLKTQSHYYLEACSQLVAISLTFVVAVELIICTNRTLTADDLHSLQGLYDILAMETVLQAHIPIELKACKDMSENFVKFIEAQIENLRLYPESEEFKQGIAPSLEKLHFLSQLTTTTTTTTATLPLANLWKEFEAQCTALIRLGRQNVMHAVKSFDAKNIVECATFLRHAAALIRCKPLAERDLDSGTSEEWLEQCESQIKSIQKAFFEALPNLSAMQILQHIVDCLLPFLSSTTCELSRLEDILTRATARLQTIISEGSFKSRVDTLLQCTTALDRIDKSQLSALRHTLGTVEADLKNQIERKLRDADIVIRSTLNFQGYDQSILSNALDSLREISELHNQSGVQALYEDYTSRLGVRFQKDLEEAASDCLGKALKQTEIFIKLYELHVPALKEYHATLNLRLQQQNDEFSELKECLIQGNYDYVFSKFLEVATGSNFKLFRREIIEFLPQQLARVRSKTDVQSRFVELEKLRILVTWTGDNSLLSAFRDIKIVLQKELQQTFVLLASMANKWQWADITCHLQQLGAPGFSWAAEPLQQWCKDTMQDLATCIRTALKLNFRSSMPTGKVLDLSVHLGMFGASNSLDVTQQVLKVDIDSWIQPLLSGQNWDSEARATELQQKFQAHSELSNRLADERKNLEIYFAHLTNFISKILRKRTRQLDCAYKALARHCNMHLNSVGNFPIALVLADTMDCLNLFHKFVDSGLEMKSQIQTVRATLDDLTKSVSKTPDLIAFCHQISKKYVLLFKSVQDKLCAIVEQELLECESLLLPQLQAKILGLLDHVQELIEKVLKRTPRMENLEKTFTNIKQQVFKYLDNIWNEYQVCLVEMRDERPSEALLVQFARYCPNYYAAIELRAAKFKKVKDSWDLYMKQVDVVVYTIPPLQAVYDLHTEEFRVRIPFSEICCLVTKKVDIAILSIDEKAANEFLACQNAGVFQLYQFCKNLRMVGQKYGLLHDELEHSIIRLERKFTNSVDGLRKKACRDLSSYEVNKSKSSCDQLLSALADCHQQVQHFAPYHRSLYTTPLDVEYADRIIIICDNYRRALKESDTKSDSAPPLPEPEVSLFLKKIFNWSEIIESKIVSETVETQIENLLFENLYQVPAIGTRLLNCDDNGNLKTHDSPSKNDSNTGQKIVEKFKVFVIERNKLFNMQTGAITQTRLLEAVCAKNGFSDAKRQRIQAAWDSYMGEYEVEVRMLFNRNSRIENSLCSVFGLDRRELLSNVPKYLARIAAAYTLINSGGSELAERLAHCRPHPMQIIAIFCVLLDQPNIQHPNALTTWSRHILEVNTGEGKSVILALLATFLALAEYEVDVVCYSKILVDRDYKDFRDLFAYFDMARNIHYSTFRDIAEEFTYRVGDIRTLTLNNLNKKDYQSASDSKTSGALTQRERILLVDEIDVFMQEGIYGSILQPVATLVSPQIYDLVEFIYLNQNATMSDVRQQQCFKDLAKVCCSNKMCEFLDYQINILLNGVSEFGKVDYTIDENGLIAYANMAGGMDTAGRHLGVTQFHFMREFERARISKEQLQAKVGFTFAVGSFSYAEILNHYQGVFGVTATYDILGRFEKNILVDKYRLTKIATVSIYGDSRLQGKYSAVCSSNTDLHYQTIRDKIVEIHSFAVKVPILVFFQTDGDIKNFVLHSKVQPWLLELRGRGDLYEIKSSEQNFERWMAKSMEAGKVTLLPAVFGRGQNFKCYVDHADAYGGVHVMQTFFSSDVSEEVQIMGRTARQINKGTYFLCVSLPDLSWLGVKVSDLTSLVQPRDVYSFLDFKRKTQHHQLSSHRVKTAKQAALAHAKTWDHLNEMVKGPISRDDVATFLLDCVSHDQPSWF